MHMEASAIKKLLIDNFSDAGLSVAMKQLWEFSQEKLVSLDFEYHARRDTGKRPANAVVCEDLLLAFDKLDSSASVPPIYCEAAHLMRILSMSPGDIASVLSNTSSLVHRFHSEVTEITTNLASYSDHVNDLKQQFKLSCEDIKESIISVLSSEVSVVKEQVSQCSASNIRAAPQKLHLSNDKVRSNGTDRSANLIFFSLPESSMVETRELVDEISTFLAGSVRDVKDLFRIGKRSEEHSRPTLVKLCTVWDKHLFLAAKTKLNNFRLRGIFQKKGSLMLLEHVHIIPLVSLHAHHLLTTLHPHPVIDHLMTLPPHLLLLKIIW